MTPPASGTLRPSPLAAHVRPRCAECGRPVGWVYLLRRDGARLHVSCGSVAMARELRAAEAGRR